MQYCYHVLPITVSAAVDMAVLSPCFTYHSACCCRPGSIVAKFYLSQGLLLWTWQYCYHVLPITVSAAVNMAVLLPSCIYHKVCCCILGSIVTLFCLSQWLLLYVWQYCYHVFLWQCLLLLTWQYCYHVVLYVWQYCYHVFLWQCQLLLTWQYCYHVFSITVSAAVLLAVLLPCFPVTVSAAVDLAILFPCFFFYHSVCCCTLGSIVAMFYLWQYLLL